MRIKSDLRFEAKLWEQVGKMGRYLGIPNNAVVSFAVARLLLEMGASLPIRDRSKLIPVLDAEYEAMRKRLAE